MNVHATQDDDRDVPDSPTAEAQRPNHAGLRFAYPTGSKPLDGYTIKRGVGRGGFGEVYYAISDGGKEVALKLIRRNFDIELRGVAHCMNLKHPNLLGLYDVRTDQHDDRWVVMEYVTGACLEDVIAAHPDGVPIEEANAWMHGIAAGVAYLHECGIVHRDLKPGNIFSDQGLVKIGDYGLSKFISCSRRSGQTESVGTVHYMAPEIANGCYGKEIDIYALGVILYEMLTGGVPFEGESVGEVLMKHLMTEPDVSSLPEPYRSIVKRSLAKDPDVRYSSATQLLAALPAAPEGAPHIHNQRRVAMLGEIPSDVLPADGVVVAEIADEPVVADFVENIPAPSASRMPEEPIWKWTRGVFAEIGQAWNKNLNTAAKVALLIVGLLVFLFAFPWISPLLVCLVSIYVVYWAIWTLFTWLSLEEPPQPRTPDSISAQTLTAAPPIHRRQHRRRRWRTTRFTLPDKPSRQRVMELFGSMFLAGLVCLVISIVMLLLRGEPAQLEQFAWLAVVSIFGTWGILIPAKMWEGKEGEPALRRFCLLVVGLAVGTLAYGVQEQLLVSLPHEFSYQPVFAEVAETGLATQAFAESPSIQSIQSITVPSPAEQLSLMTCLSYFGFLFLLIRWWRLADPLRSARLSLWTTAVCVTWSGAIYLFWPFPASWDVFPQPWGFMAAATVAVATQLASPWISPKIRKAALTA